MEGFEKTANTERFEYFAEEVQLDDATKGESCEIDTIYLEFSEKAKIAGDTAAAARFRKR